MNTNTRKIIALVALLLLGTVIYFYYRNTASREIVLDKKIKVTESAKSFHLSTNGLMIFDNNLYILNRDGDLIKTVKAKNVELEAFFANNYAFLYDQDLGRISQYQDSGEFIRNIKITDTLFNIKYENKNFILHTKYENGERLWCLTTDGKLKKIYESANSILAYDVKDMDTFVIAELKVETNGYTTNCVIKNSSKNKTYSNGSEVALAVKYSDSRVVMVTNKNLYAFEGDEVKSVEIPNMSDVAVVDRSVYLLHSGILSKYNSKLEEVTKHIVAANVEKLQQVSKSLYAYSNSDIAGNLLQRNEFYYRFPSEAEKIEISGIRIGVLQDGTVTLYKVTNGRNEVGEVNKWVH